MTEPTVVAATATVHSCANKNVSATKPQLADLRVENELATLTNTASSAQPPITVPSAMIRFAHETLRGS